MIDAFFTQLSSIFKPTFKVSFRGESILSDSSSKPVKVLKSGKALFLKLDQQRVEIFPWYDHTLEKLCQIPDYFIFYPTEQSVFVFIIELKTNNTTGSFKQVEAGYELSKYFCATTRRIMNYQAGIDIQYRGLIFSSRREKKGTTKPKNLKFEYKKGPDLYYKHLMSGFTVDLDALAKVPCS